MKDASILPDNDHVRTERITVCCAAGRLSAEILYPDWRVESPPLLVLHGISRNADTLARYFASQAQRTGRCVIVPHFNKQDWPVFQRPTKTARPDQALLELLNYLATRDPDLAGPVDIFGHSGGAQLAHRAAMLYPHRVSALHLAAAGWYCLPDRSMPYPYGLAAGKGVQDLKWVNRHAIGLETFLRLPLTLYIGTHDTERDDSLRQVPMLDAGQGLTRLARAHCYLSAFKTAACAAGIAPCAKLIELPGCVHDVVEAITRYDLATLVMDSSPDKMFL
ncbi:MAG: hypothetical protein COW54_04785 [Rhodobacteraceae bacterium CG17_big_fil_post_rev_8_21_14_2_50_63_15]|nr:alpha/beta hydrolase [Roseovarius sp.]PIV79282.1 MAG: hypothetical protein COW54_04785 [Rhodobacteraceae bacterium CG17_big_fil_post_rev_8_21_14_2_50_63_15]